jgi:hypothetical protein
MKGTPRTMITLEKEEIYNIFEELSKDSSREYYTKIVEKAFDDLTSLSTDDIKTLALFPVLEKRALNTIYKHTDDIAAYIRLKKYCFDNKLSFEDFEYYIFNNLIDIDTLENNQLAKTLYSDNSIPENINALRSLMYLPQITKIISSDNNVTITFADSDEITAKDFTTAIATKAISEKNLTGILKILNTSLENPNSEPKIVFTPIPEPESISEPKPQTVLTPTPEPVSEPEFEREREVSLKSVIIKMPSKSQNKNLDKPTVTDKIKGITIGELAAELNISYNTVYKLLRKLELLKTCKQKDGTILITPDIIEKVKSARNK